MHEVSHVSIKFTAHPPKPTEPDGKNCQSFHTVDTLPVPSFASHYHVKTSSYNTAGYYLSSFLKVEDIPPVFQL